MIVVRALDANLLNDADFLDRMVLTSSSQDPYLVIYCGGERKQSTVREEGGRNPRWGDTFTFNRSGDPMIRVQIWDKDTFSADDMVGEGQANIMGVLNSPPGMAATIPVDLFNQGRPAGRVNLSVSVGGGYVTL